MTNWVGRFGLQLFVGMVSTGVAINRDLSTIKNNAEVKEVERGAIISWVKLFSVHNYLGVLSLR